MDTIPTDKMVTAYIRIRDKRKEIKDAYEAEDAILEAKLDAVAKALVAACNVAGTTTLKTPFGTATKTVKTRYWTSDWAEFYKVVREMDQPELLERRISQTNFKEFLAKHPDKLPKGVNVDSKYDVTVRRASSSKTGENNVEPSDPV